MSLTAHQKVVRAARTGTGVRLSALEADELGGADGAVETVATLDAIAAGQCEYCFRTSCPRAKTDADCPRWLAGT